MIEITKRPFSEEATYEVKYLYLGGVVETHVVRAHCHDCALDLAQPERHDLDLNAVFTKEIK